VGAQELVELGELGAGAGGLAARGLGGRVGLAASAAGGVGGAVGVAAALAIGRAAQSLLFGLDGHDPRVVTAAAAVLAAVALGAGWLPAWRASRVSPTAALRGD
jgi:ABC-type antimicrobial peptide transport system permease subunit